MTIVLTVLIGVGLALIASCIVALVASAVVGGVIAVFSGPYAAARAVIRHRSGRVQERLTDDQKVLGPTPVIEPLRPVDTRQATAVPVPNRWSWLRPLAMLFLVSSVAVLLDGPDPLTRRRRRPRR